MGAVQPCEQGCSAECEVDNLLSGVVRVKVLPGLVPEQKGRPVDKSPCSLIVYMDEGILKIVDEEDNDVFETMCFKPSSTMLFIKSCLHQSDVVPPSCPIVMRHGGKVISNSTKICEVEWIPRVKRSEGSATGVARHSVARASEDCTPPW